MKANEFIKKYGLEESRKYLKEFNGLNHVYMGGGFYIDDLKHLIYSHDLVGNFGGIKRAKRILKRSYQSWGTKVSVVWNDKPFQCNISDLEQAINDVESCQ